MRYDLWPVYLNLAGIWTHFLNIPIAAFTATATKKVQEGVTQKLENNVLNNKCKKNINYF